MTSSSTLMRTVGLVTCPVKAVANDLLALAAVCWMRGAGGAGAAVGSTHSQRESLNEPGRGEGRGAYNCEEVLGMVARYRRCRFITGWLVAKGRDPGAELPNVIAHVVTSNQAHCHRHLKTYMPTVFFALLLQFYAAVQADAEDV